MPPSPSATPPPRLRPIALPAYRKPPRKKPAPGLSTVTLTLLITVPAVIAVAVLRPRSS
ncbi:hypothetical protein GCM10010278_00900 [Streptomyces melanogenes]|nr:hypothetical protein GCM10010278_00900 [Streptomyces melanogenes]